MKSIPAKNLLAALLSCALAVAALPGCVLHPGSARPTTVGELRAEGGWTLLETVPWVPQESAKDCGAAAVSMVLRHWGEEAKPAELFRECAAPGVDGLRAAELRDAARRRGLSAFVFPGKAEDLEHELARGRPVVVGLVKTFGPLTLTHFEVVVGLRPDGGGIAAMDPAMGFVRDSMAAFEAEWNAAGRVTLVVFRPDSKTVARSAGGP